MKKALTVFMIVALLLGVAGCGAQLTDLELLQKAYTNMQEIESFKSTGSIIIKMMGMTMDPLEYDILYQKPDKTYLSIDADVYGVGETLTIEYLVQGDDVRIRSDFLDELEPEFRISLEESMATEMENPLSYGDMFMDFADMTVFEATDNPDGLDAKQFKTYKLMVDGEMLKQQAAEEMGLTEDAFAEELEGLSEGEKAEFLKVVEEILDTLKVEIDAIVVVDAKTQYYHSLQMNMAVEMPIPSEPQGEIDVVGINYTIIIDYLEINTDLEFPEF